MVNLNGEPAIRVYGHILQETELAVLLKTEEGDLKWIPKKVSKYVDTNKSLLVRDWWYNKHFKNA